MKNCLTQGLLFAKPTMSKNTYKFRFTSPEEETYSLAMAVGCHRQNKIRIARAPTARKKYEGKMENG